MRRTRALWEVFVRRFEDAFRQYRRSRLTAEEAGELLGMSGRQFRRLCVRFADEGVEGLGDRRNGKASPRRAPARELERMRQLYRDRYSDFTVKHFHEQLVRRHSYKLGYTVTRLLCRRPAWWRRRSGAAHIVRGVRADRCRACCCSRTVRHIAGLRAWSGSSTWWSRSTMPQARSIRRSWWSRRAPCRAFSGLPRRSPNTGCSVRSIPIGAAITSSPRAAAERSTRRT